MQPILYRKPVLSSRSTAAGQEDQPYLAANRPHAQKHIKDRTLASNMFSHYVAAAALKHLSHLVSRMKDHLDDRSLDDSGGVLRMDSSSRGVGLLGSSAREML